MAADAETASVGASGPSAPMLTTTQQDAGPLVANAKRPITKGRNTLLRTAVVHLDGFEALRPRSWPREIALEFLGPTAPPLHPSRAWMVHPEKLWPQSCADRSHETELTPGIGMSPRRVAEELADVLEGHKVYSEASQVTNRWLELLFNAAGLGKPQFVVRDVWVLFQRLLADPVDIGAAERVALSTSEHTKRASAEALKHAEFARALKHLADSRKAFALPKPPR